MSETLQIFGEQFTNVAGIKAYKPNGDVVTFTAGGGADLAAFIQRTISGDLVNGDVTTVGQDAFNGCKSLSSISLPNCTQVQTRGLDGTSAAAIYLPKVRNLNAQSVIAYNTNLINMVLPALATNIGQYGMQGCTKLQACDLGANATGINAAVFSGCTVLDTLILRRTSAVATLSNTNVFTNSPFASGKAGGILYVPQTLISSYKSATNWSTILGYANNMILPIEGSPYETHYADGTEVSGATESSSIYAVSGWGITGANGEVPYVSKGTPRGSLINLKGDHPIRLNSTTGNLTAIYPIPIPTGKTGVIVTSDSMDVSVIECLYENDDWKRITSSGWMLMSDGTSHMYNFNGNGTTHMWAVLREAGNDTGTVTDAMCDAVQFAWV